MTGTQDRLDNTISEKPHPSKVFVSSFGGFLFAFPSHVLASALREVVVVCEVTDVFILDLESR